MAVTCGVRGIQITARRSKTAKQAKQLHLNLSGDLAGADWPCVSYLIPGIFAPTTCLG